MHYNKCISTPGVPAVMYQQKFVPTEKHLHSADSTKLASEQGHSRYIEF